ncbi:MAG: ATP-binding cassette domain-containing protein [Ignavibacteriae bacterium]|nr:MAG: ATP-binding cassette domain-containing protein [Ignavibacteriota bacterium]
MTITLDHATVAFNGIAALSDVSATITTDQPMVLTGPTGAGKTTLLRLLYADLLPTGGQVLVDGVSTSSMKAKQRRAHRQRLGIVQQDCRLVSDYTVFDNVLMPYALRGVPKTDADRQCLELLADLNISYVKHKLPRQLSGGEQHLVALARALAMQPELIIADEPTGTLDDVTSNDVAIALKHAINRGVGLVVSTHSTAFAEALAGARVLKLSEGSIVHNQQPSTDDGRRTQDEL